MAFHLIYAAKLSKQPGPPQLKVLVLVPTRELAAQIGEVAREFGQHLQPWVKSGAVFGGVALDPQMIMVNNVELLIATRVDCWNWSSRTVCSWQRWRFWYWMKQKRCSRRALRGV